MAKVGDYFVMEGNGVLKCDKCGETYPLKMPIGVELMVCLAYGFQVYHLKKCFHNEEPYTDLEEIVRDAVERLPPKDE